MLRWMSLLLLTGSLAYGADYEAETGEPAPACLVETYDGASGGKILRFTGRSRMKKTMVDPAVPDKVIRFKTDRPGSWQITAVVCTENTGNDSVYYRVDQGELQELHTGFPKKCVSFSMGIHELKAGEHTLSLYRREPRFGLDKITVKQIIPPPRMVSFPGKPGPDATYTLKANPGSYYLRIRATVPQPGPQYDARITIGDQIPVTRRIIFPTVAKGQYEVERIAMGNEPVKVRIETKPEVTITHVQLEPVRKRLPKAAVDYVPPIRPRTDRPRLLINRESLAKIKRNIQVSPSHKQAWQWIARQARRPYKFAPEPGREVQWDNQVITAMQTKAFYFLITGDKKIAREACELAVAYFKVVNFGNGQDICRRTGAAIKIASKVYDWCYSEMTPEERAILRDRFLWQAESMEIGWPPFLQSINVGHGNEAQLNKDLLSMAIAIYDEDPVPWKYCTYRLLEEARPMKSYLYKSGYHYEGMAYGTVRYDSDITAAFLLKQATGFDQFEPYVGKVPYAWFHLRLPDGDLFRNGDDYIRNRTFPGFEPIYLVSNALWPDPKLKAGYLEYFAGSAKPYSSSLYYLMMMLDPDQKADFRRDDLPKARYFGEPVSMLTARTGWAYGLASDDVLVQMTGAAIHHASHQHHDAGAFQLYYRGMLAADIGQYRYFGKPYDMDFAKSSMSHSVMRLIDPQQKKFRWARHKHLRDAGLQEVTPSGPALLDHILKKPEIYTNGKMLNVSEDPVAPYLQLELSPAYPTRAKSYIRTMVFLAAEHPALVVFDELDLVRKDIKPVWQITTWDKPVQKGDQVIAGHTKAGMPSRLTMTTLLPRKHQTLILSGKEAHKVLGVQYHPPFPDHPGARGSRTEVTAAPGENNTRFLHILQPTPGTDAKPVSMQEKDGVITLSADGWSLVLTPGKAPQATVTKPRKAFVPPKDTVYLDGKVFGKLDNGRIPLLLLLNAKNIPWKEVNHVLDVDGLTIVAQGVDGPANSLQLPRVDGVWMVTPAEAAGITGCDLQYDRWNNCWFLISKTGNAVRWLSATAVPQAPLAAWRKLLEQENGSLICEGLTVLTGTLRKAQKLSGISLRYLYGDLRKDHLKIEISPDGKTFKTVFDGQTGGQSNDFQDFTFPAQPVQNVRLTLNGNSVNNWNNLSGFRLISAK